MWFKLRFHDSDTNQNIFIYLNEFIIFLWTETEPRLQCILDKDSITELHNHLFICIPLKDLAFEFAQTAFSPLGRQNLWGVGGLREDIHDRTFCGHCILPACLVIDLCFISYELVYIAGTELESISYPNVQAYTLFLSGK